MSTAEHYIHKRTLSERLRTITERVNFIATPNNRELYVGQEMFLKRETASGHETNPLIECIRTYVKKSDLLWILNWADDPETRKHLVPAPQVPENWSDEEQIAKAQQELADYYNNYGKPEGITPFVALKPSGKPIAVATLRWEGDQYTNDQKDKRIAIIERLIVDPQEWGKGVGSIFVATMIEYAFQKYTGYEGKGAKEIRAWVMNKGEWPRNRKLFRKCGFQVMGHWLEQAEKFGEKSDDDADLLRLKPRWWRRAKRDRADLTPIANLEEKIDNRAA